MRRFLLGTCAAALALLAAAAAGQEADGPVVPLSDVRVSLTPGTGTVGDRFVYSIKTVRGESTRIVYPDVMEGAPAFEVVDVVDHPERRVESGVRGRRDYVLAVFETGLQSVPGLTLRAVEGGETLSVALDSVSVEIGSVLPDSLDQASMEPREIEPPVDLPREFWPYVLIAGIIAAALVAWWLVRRYVRPWWRRPREEREEEPPPVPRVAAHLVAFERLRALRDDDPIGRGDLETFYVRVTAILKAYVRDRYGVDVVDMTTGEVGAAMRAARIPVEDTDRLEAFLKHADLAKFAKALPAVERAREDLDEAWSFVERTRLQGEEADA
ncbi:MAG: hypothetical protein GF405_06100 [Candidatus Eisenbacteria bacterium]|nr:hypothetical protein [Candidatus Eisenbacteria bacterium]